MLLWANLHGGFIFGILAWAAYFAGWLWGRWRNKTHNLIGIKLVAVGITSLIATIITPAFWRNWEAVLNNRSTFILNRTIETMRPDLTDTSVLPFTFLLFLTILFYSLYRKNFKAHHFFLLTGLGIISLLMARNIPLFAIACSPILSEMGGRSLSRFKTWTQIEERYASLGITSRQSVYSITAILLTLIYFIFIRFTNDQPVYTFDTRVFPVKAATYLETNPQNVKMFNEFNWGGYLLYRLWPEEQVFIDSQTDFYGEGLSREYVQVASLQLGWENILSKYDVEWVIMQPEQPLVGALLERDWVTLYQDSTAIILRKP
jgi:hypothetical protein